MKIINLATGDIGEVSETIYKDRQTLLNMGYDQYELTGVPQFTTTTDTLNPSYESLKVTMPDETDSSATETNGNETDTKAFFSTDNTEDQQVKSVKKPANRKKTK